MKKFHMNIFLTVGVVMLFLVSSIGSEVAGFIQTARQDSAIKKNNSTNNEVMVSCIAGGIPTKKQISFESCQCLQQLFSALIEANAHNPCGENTRVQKVRFIEMLADLGLIAHDISVEEICSLIEPPWSHDVLSRRWGHLMPPRSLDDENNATLLFCSMAGTGWGFVIPPFLLPRPRLLMQWRGFYPDSSAVSVAEMATGRGVIARGTQVGTAFGFIGVGFAFAFPGAPAQFGFLGYSLLTKLQGADMTWYYANFPPLVMEMSPEDGAVEVPVSLSELQFTLKDYDWDKMTYNVVTSPDIGSGADSNVGNGAYSIPVSGLESGTTYIWTVTVSDGTDTVENSFTFTTEAVAPVVLSPIPANGEKNVPMDITQLQFTLKDPQSDAMDYTVETSPNIGSVHVTGVHDGTYTVPINGMTYGATYRWYLNVTDGVHWTRKIFSFETGYPSQFDPFEFGWQYRKQITVDHTKVASDLTDFPVFISISDSDLQTKAQTDGDDILFMDGIGIPQQLNHEIEQYDGTTGELFAWVNIPSISSTVDTTFYMYYGNSECSSQQHVEDTWNSNFKAVWHLQGNPTQTIQDSTRYENDGTAYGSMSSSDLVYGKIGKCLEFDGVNDYISVPDSSSLKPTDLTLIAWYNPAEETPLPGYFVAKQCHDYWGNSAGQTYSFGINGNNLIHGGFEANTYEQVDSVGSYPVINNIWSHLTLTFNKATQEGICYVNGVLNDVKNPCDSSVLWYSDPWDFTMGGSRFGTGSSHVINRFYNCGLDEIRLLNTPLSEGWISTEFNNQNNPSSFLSIGPEVPGP